MRWLGLLVWSYLPIALGHLSDRAGGESNDALGGVGGFFTFPSLSPSF